MYKNENRVFDFKVFITEKLQEAAQNMSVNRSSGLLVVFTLLCAYYWAYFLEKQNIRVVLYGFK